MTSSAALRTFTVLYNHHHYPSPETFASSQTDLVPINNSLFFTPRAPGIHLSSFCKILTLLCCYVLLVASGSVESSRTRERTHVPCVGRRILTHWSARKALWAAFWWKFFLSLWVCYSRHAQRLNKRASLTVRSYYICCNSYLLHDSVKQTFYKSLCISSLKEMVTGGFVNPGGAMIAF